MTVQEYEARRIERMARVLAHYVATTSEQHLEWCPTTSEESCTRCVLEQIRECVAVNRMIAALIRCDGCEPAETGPITGSASAQEELIASAREVAEVIRGMSDELLDKRYTTPRATMTGEVLIELPGRNMTYHGGQINFIQLLLGDREFHMHPHGFR